MRKLGLREETATTINSAWFRLAGGLDIEDWADPDDEESSGGWRSPACAGCSTNHLMGRATGSG